MIAHRHLREEPCCWFERRGNRFYDEEINRGIEDGMGFGVEGFVFMT